MWTKAELFGFITDREHKADAPSPAPAKSEETYREMLLRRNREEVAAGKAVSMNDLLRSIPKPKLPRRPSWDR